MGFSRRAAEVALKALGGIGEITPSPESIVGWILEHQDQVMEMILMMMMMIMIMTRSWRWSPRGQRVPGRTRTRAQTLSPYQSHLRQD